MKRSKQKGITLIALVITIIVLLILAGVSIATLTGQNGILTQANTAKTQTERAKVIEEAKTDVLGIQAENQSGEITKGQLKTVLDKYFKTVPEDYTIDTVLNTKDEYGNYQIKVSEIYNGSFADGEEQGENISKTESYVGWYADLNDDGQITLEEDGIIYADQAIGGSGELGTNGLGTYTIPQKENVKEYKVISETSTEDPFKTGKRIIQLVEESSAEDRFYVMALQDIDSNIHYWYKNAYGNMADYATATSGDFGTGKTNTETMIAKFDKGSVENGGYGEKDPNDMWGLIKTEVSEGWFVASRGEWSAFAQELGIPKDYTSVGLSVFYWSSSQYNAFDVYNAYIDLSYTYNYSVNNISYVRLSRTF